MNIKNFLPTQQFNIIVGALSLNDIFESISTGKEICLICKQTKQEETFSINVRFTSISQIKKEQKPIPFMVWGGKLDIVEDKEFIEERCYYLDLKKCIGFVHDKKVGKKK